MRSLFLRCVLNILLFLGLVSSMILAADAFEWEVTGACNDCVLLNKMADRYRD